MKKNFLIVGLTVLISLSAFGQNFISPDKRWNVLLTGFPTAFSTEIYVINGDSVVDLTVYNKIWASSDSLTTWQYKGLLREDSNIVYYTPPGESEGVLYNFNLNIGDTAYVINVFCSNIPIYIIDIDTVEYLGISRKRWHLGENGNVEEFWVEGIGSLYGPLFTKYAYCIICPGWELLCFHEDDTLRYMMPYTDDCYLNTVGISENSGENDFLISPNPVKKGNDIFLETTSKVSSINIFNPAGILIKTINPVVDNINRIETHNFEPGLYLIAIKTRGNKMITRKILIYKT